MRGRLLTATPHSHSQTTASSLRIQIFLPLVYPLPIVPLPHLLRILPILFLLLLPHLLLPKIFLETKVTAKLETDYLFSPSFVFVSFLSLLSFYNFSLVNAEYPDAITLAHYLASIPLTFTFLLAEKDIQEILPYTIHHSAKFCEEKMSGALVVAEYITSASVQEEQKFKFKKLCLKHYKGWPR